jgi:DNA invertase Pin-like site-specific DNA recombinase
MPVAIYARVSTNQQDTRSQETDLKAWAAQQEAKGESVAWYRDKSTGTNFRRDGWEQLDSDIRTGRVSRIAVWRLDRLGRTAGETIQLLDTLDSKGIGFLSLRDGFDPSTPSGRLQRNILASVAQFETEVRQERQMAGIAAAKAAGKTWGGRKVGTRITLTEEKEQLCQKLRAEGQSVASIARNLGIARKTVYVALRRQG